MPLNPLALWLCALLYLATCACWAEDMRFERLFTDTAAAERSLGAVDAIVQDRQGFMWFGSENGLARYDGVTLKTYRSNPHNPHSLPNNYVWDLLLDKTGVLWVATDAGLVSYNRDTDDFTRYQNQPGSRDPHGDLMVVHAIACDEQNTLYLAAANGLVKFDANRSSFTPLFSEAVQGPSSQKYSPYILQSLSLDNQHNLWIGTVYDGLYRLHLPDGQLSHFAADPNNPQALSYPHVQDVERDAQGRIWVSTLGGGINRLNADGQTFTHYQTTDGHSGLTSDTVISSYLDSRGNLWFLTDQGGLLRYDPSQDRFISFKHNDYDTTSLSSNQLRVMYEDQQGDLWVGAFPSGVNYFNLSTDLFTNYFHKPDNANSLSNSAILSLLEDSEGLIWIGTESGLTSYDPRSQTFTRYSRDAPGEHNLPANAILSLLEDRQHNIWIGTWGNGLYQYERTSHRLKSYQPDSNNPKSLNSLYVWSMVQDSEGIMWLGTQQGGLNRLDPTTGEFTHYVNDPNDSSSINQNTVWSLEQDGNGDLWLGTSGCLDRFNKKTQSFNHYEQLGDEPLGGTAIRIRIVKKDSLGRLWVGTQDNGVFIYNPATQGFTHLTETDGLPASQVASVLEDSDHFIWLGTSNGLARLEGKTLAMRVFQQSHGLPGNNFNRNASLAARNGKLFFGSTAGLSAFDPHSLVKNTNAFPVTITDLRIFNESITPQNRPQLLSKAINQTQALFLPYTDNMLSFSFSALNFREAKYNSYAYKLEGFDTNWTEVGPRQSANYTNLSPGDYVFRVKAADRDGDWSPQTAQLQIHIAPPPWRTLWAFLAYFLAAAVLVFWIIKNIWRHFELEKQKTLNAELVNLDQIKDTFLANTSHELRTPLNGMIGLAQALLDEAPEYLPPHFVQRLELIMFSGKRLSALINDILDYSKNKNHKLQLFLSPVSLHQAIDKALMLLMPLAQAKSLALVNQVAEDLPLIEADENRLQQILLNLISNAIKYTDQGSVTLSAQAEGDYLLLRVQDTGIGIAPEHRGNLFKAFAQLENGQRRLQGGTGLGLSVSKELVELHGGQLTVESELHKGSTFSVSLPLAQTGLAASPAPSLPLPSLSQSNSLPSSSPLSSLPLSSRQAPATDPLVNQPPALRDAQRLPAASSYRLLIVDDDAVNRMVLDSLLKIPGYQLAQAASGPEAIAYVAQHPVDLIILDVMMPGMTGYQACEILRRSYPIEDLPIIFLTANKVDDEVMKGFSAGGNEFLTKPVSKAELLPRVANHLHLLTLYRQLKQASPN